jgi:hypothetical protein
MRERVGHVREFAEERFRAEQLVGCSIDDIKVVFIIPMGVDEDIFRDEPVLADFIVHIRRAMPV